MNLKLVTDKTRKDQLILNPNQSESINIHLSCLECVFRGHPDCDELLEQVSRINPPEFEGACGDSAYFQYFAVE